MTSDSTLAQISNDDLSRVIGLIYDCAIDPACWPKALEAMCGLVGATFGSIALHDPWTRRARYSVYWGADPNFQHWVRLLEDKYAALMPFYDSMPFADLDEPMNTAMMAQFSGRHDFYQSPFYLEWAKPAGLKDTISTILIRSESQFCVFGMHTPPSRDLAGPRDIAISRMLSPHIKRAVLIGDLLDMRALEAVSVKSTLDLLSTAVLLTDGEAQVIHANAAARAMLAEGDPVQITLDKLTAVDDNATNALRKAIAKAAAAEFEMGSSGIGVPVLYADGRPAIAHVLPLATPPLRSQLAASVKAAVFISTTATHLAPVEALAALFELTPAEQKVLASVLADRNQAETAIHLKIAESTVKTHLGRIFSKTRTTNQADLTRLAERLTARLTPTR